MGGGRHRQLWVRSMLRTRGVASSVGFVVIHSKCRLAFQRGLNMIVLAEKNTGSTITRGILMQKRVLL